IETTVNYPIPAYRQNAYLQNIYLANTEEACASVLSIPVYPEITEQQINYICNTILKFFSSE
ncbi:MAG TPA: DegT/DnrJ/EryC1/StrS family aminotransferase, partial [Chitinophagales bacterium]|nr:DegT/DnrJ/EryC1/StrS family aminotransferase [Chitinophagales bacterium]